MVSSYHEVPVRDLTYVFLHSRDIGIATFELALSSTPTPERTDLILVLSNVWMKHERAV